MKLPETIECQACTPESRKNGCSRCGGYGRVAELVLCHNKCGKAGLFRPGPTTTYEGKQVTSWDGLDMIYAMDGILCVECYAEKIKR